MGRKKQSRTRTIVHKAPVVNYAEKLKQSNKTVWILAICFAVVFIIALALAGKLSNETQSSVNYCHSYNAQVEMSNICMNRLKEYDYANYPMQKQIKCADDD